MNTLTVNIQRNFHYNSTINEILISSDYSIPMISENNSKAIQTINSYRTLNDNWDSYGAEAPKSSAIIKAITFILLLSKYEVEVFFVAPTPDGEILVEIKHNNANLEFELSASSNDIITASQNGEFISEAELNDTTFISYLRWLVHPNGK